MKDHTPQPAGVPAPKPYATPRLRKEARIELVTAGSFDLNIPNAP